MIYQLREAELRVVRSPSFAATTAGTLVGAAATAVTVFTGCAGCDTGTWGINPGQDPQVDKTRIRHRPRIPQPRHFPWTWGSLW